MVPFTIAARMCRIRLLPKNMQVVGRLTEDLNKWKDILCSWIGRVNIIKMSVLPKLIYGFKSIKSK